MHDIATDSDDDAIVNAITQLGRSLKLRTIAEGVKTEAQLAFLHRCNCDEVQGYYFSPPVPPEAFADLLRGPVLPTGQQAAARGH